MVPSLEELRKRLQTDIGAPNADYAQVAAEHLAKVEASLAKAYAVMMRVVIGNDDPTQDTWKCAARHNDIEGASEWCARINDITEPEAKVLVEHYVRTCVAQSRLLGVPVSQTPLAQQN